MKCAMNSRHHCKHSRKENERLAGWYAETGTVYFIRSSSTYISLQLHLASSRAQHILTFTQQMYCNNWKEKSWFPFCIHFILLCLRFSRSSYFLANCVCFFFIIWHPTLGLELCVYNKDDTVPPSREINVWTIFEEKKSRPTPHRYAVRLVSIVNWR